MTKKVAEKKWPSLSIKERDRRWNLAKAMMNDKGIDCLIVSSDGFNTYDNWFTNDLTGGIVIFPLKEDPVYLVWRTSHGIIRMVVDQQRGIEPWIKDYRTWMMAGEGIVNVIKEKGLEITKIGIIGGSTFNAGGIPVDAWSYVQKGLPNVNFIDIMMPFAEIVLVKSEEELTLARHAAQIGELACDAMIKTVKPGVSENIIYAAIMNTILVNGASTRYLITHTGTGFPSFSWGVPSWTFQGQPPPVVKKGDLVQAEIFPTYGSMQTQQQMAVATKPVSPLINKLAGVARSAYEAGIQCIRPGITFGEVCETMIKPLDKAGCWNLTPLIHSMNPLLLVSPQETMVEELPELKGYRVEAHKTLRPWASKFVIKEGMIFELEPNACRDNQKVNLGGTVIVTKNGVEELNKLSTQMRIAD